MNYNKAIILGNLTRDPETRTLPSGQPIATFGIATNRIYTDQNGAKQQATEFHNVVTFGKLADICSRYLTKGSLTLIEGRIQTRNWIDQSGVKKYRTEIVAQNMQMGPKRQPTGNTETTSQPQTPTEEIPIIDSEEPYSAGLSSESEGSPSDSEDKEEIEAKNVPF